MSDSQSNLKQQQNEADRALAALAPTSARLLQAARLGKIEFPWMPDADVPNAKQAVSAFVCEYPLYDISLTEAQFDAIYASDEFFYPSAASFDFFPGEAASVCVRLTMDYSYSRCIMCRRLGDWITYRIIDFYDEEPHRAIALPMQAYLGANGYKIYYDPGLSDELKAQAKDEVDEGMLLLNTLMNGFRDRPREMASQPSMSVRNGRAQPAHEAVRSPQLVRKLDLSQAIRVRAAAKGTGTGAQKSAHDRIMHVWTNPHTGLRSLRKGSKIHGGATTPPVIVVKLPEPKEDLSA